MSESRQHYRSDHHEDAEAYRSRRRDQDRRHRDNEEESRDNGHSGKTRSNGRDQFQQERAERMARLRQEMQREDEDLLALDHKQHEPTVRQVKPQEDIIEVKEEELEGLDEEEQMRKLLGIEGFGSTKGEAVADNQSTAARGVAAKNKARKYRQYMNRQSGFNRPLEKMD